MPPNKRTASVASIKEADNKGQSSAESKAKTAKSTYSSNGKTTSSRKKQSNTPFPFLKLARELRDKIYECAVGWEEVCFEYDSDGDTETRRKLKTYRVKSTGDVSQEPGLLSTCHQIRSEALPTFYGHNIFVFVVRDTHFCPLFKWLDNLGADRCGMLKRVALLFDGLDEPPSMAKPLERLRETLKPSEALSLQYFGVPPIVAAMEHALDIVQKLRFHGLDYNSIDYIEEKFQSMAYLLPGFCECSHGHVSEREIEFLVHDLDDMDFECGQGDGDYANHYMSPLFRFKEDEDSDMWNEEWMEV
ncbi:MAG: hypothetical protein M1831_005947 [Alyxoria varia]|nr:MAG: hypothetical protein M1831_005947 [Alyxoria varia]